FKITKFDNASKDLDKLLESQRSDKNKEGLGYHAVAPPHPLIYNRPTKLDLSYLGLDEFKEPEFNGYGPRDTMLESTKDCSKKSDNSKKNIDDSVETKQVSEDTSSSSNDTYSLVESALKVDRETVIDWHNTVVHSDKKKVFIKPKNNEKPVKKTVRYAQMYISQSPRGNQRNWNGQKSNQLGSEFVMYNKTCFICGSFNHLQKNCTYHQKKKVVNGKNYNRVDYDYYTKTSHPRTHKNMTPRAVLLKSGLKPLSTARLVYTGHPKPTVHYARPKTYFYKLAQSIVQRPFYKKPPLTNWHFNHKVNTVRTRIVNTAWSYRTPVNTVKPRVVNTARPFTSQVNTVRENGVNAVKTSACWGNLQMYNKGFVDSGCSRYITGNIAYLSNFKEFNGGHVTFGGISGKGTLKTDSLDFDDVYFVKELNFNLFSVSQMCDKRNYVLFTGCLVLSPNFKLPDESQIHLKIPREDNMYSFDMKNIIPKNSLTCLAAKATLDESMLWHRRLGNINFKNINKLVKENLVRGLPLQRFENDQTCVACLKGKQHKASSTKDETSEILKNFIIQIENLVDQKVKIIRCDNGIEFKNKVMDDFCKEKGIKREFSITRTPQQNGVAERRNMTLIGAARTMLADSKLPTTFWAEAVSTTCYVQ
ncbi:putative ribonuclease H-like domain-containing protein, partial [Tanacetum coccineum]